MQNQFYHSSHLSPYIWSHFVNNKNLEEMKDSLVAVGHNEVVGAKTFWKRCKFGGEMMNLKIGIKWSVGPLVGPFAPPL